jgi:glyoxylase-like metal-dependent hydrolase (beta-lactamase superfamily II)
MKRRRLSGWSYALLLVLPLALYGAIASGRAFFAATETTVTELAPGVFFRKTQTEPEFIGCNQGWVIFKDYVLVIDANFPNQADEVIKLIRAQTDKPIRYVFDTHYHGDHADGNIKYHGATPVASERSKLEFETKGIAGFEGSKKSKPDEYGALDYKQPDLYFPHELVFDDGTQRVELLHIGHGHTLGDAVAWLPQHGILFTGDACVNGAFNYMGDGDTASWISVLTTLEELPVKTVAPGHGELAGKELLAMQKRYFVELRAAIQHGIDAGQTLDEIKAGIDLPFYKEWAGVEAKMQVENIEHVYKELNGAKR